MKTAGFAAQREATDRKIETSTDRPDARLNSLTDAVVGLAESVGQVKGRTGVLTAVE